MSVSTNFSTTAKIEQQQKRVYINEIKNNEMIEKDFKSSKTLSKYIKNEFNHDFKK